MLDSTGSTIELILCHTANGLSIFYRMFINAEIIISSIIISFIIMHFHYSTIVYITHAVRL